MPMNGRESREGKQAPRSPSPHSEGLRGRRWPGRGGPSCLPVEVVVRSEMPLSPTLSPLVPHGEREKTSAPQVYHRESLINLAPALFSADDEQFPPARRAPNRANTR